MRHLRAVSPALSPAPFGRVLGASIGPDATAPLQRLISEMFESERVVLTDSGTSALALALRRCSARVAAPVCALPAFGCYDLATAALAAGQRVRLYDVDPATLGPDLSSLRNVLKQGANSVVVAHLYGIPADLDAVSELAAEYGAALIEDAAQGAGGFWGSSRLGAVGDLGILSFGRGKGITGGGGGALLIRADDGTPSPTLPPQSPFRSVAAVFSLVTQQVFSRPSLYWIPSSLPFLRLGDSQFHPPQPASRMSGVGARVVLGALRGMDADADLRTRTAERLQEVARQAHAGSVYVDPRGRPGWLRFPVVLSSKEERRMRMASALGMAPGYPIALSNLPELQPAILAPTPALGAVHLAAALVTLPTHALVAPEDMVRLEAWIRESGARDRIILGQKHREPSLNLPSRLA